MPFWDSLSALATAGLAALSQPLHALALVCAGLAGLLVVVSAFVKTMIPLRWLAVGSNAGFIVFGLIHGNVLLVLLNGVLLPVNVWRVGQMVKLTRRVSASAVDPRQMEVWLKPYMRARQRRTGRMVFRKGDIADRLYFLASGEIELPELGIRLQAGQMFGEIAFFAPDRRRSLSARCATDCTILSIDEDTFKQLVYQNPDFGLEVVRLIAGRLSRDVQRLQERTAAQASETT
jgi:hypothetical protein